MSAAEIDAYLAGLDEPKRSTLTTLRDQLARILPDAEQCISYRLPAFRVPGGVVAGFGAFAHHLAYLPHSGSVLATLGDELSAYGGGTKSSLHFPVEAPLPAALVRRLVNVRLEEIDRRRR